MDTAPEHIAWSDHFAAVREGAATAGTRPRRPGVTTETRTAAARAEPSPPIPLWLIAVVAAGVALVALGLFVGWSRARDARRGREVPPELLSGVSYRMDADAAPRRRWWPLG